MVAVDTSGEHLNKCPFVTRTHIHTNTRSIEVYMHKYTSTRTFDKLRSKRQRSFVSRNVFMCARFFDQNLNGSEYDINKRCKHVRNLYVARTDWTAGHLCPLPNPYGRFTSWGEKFNRTTYSPTWRFVREARDVPCRIAERTRGRFIR